MNFTTEQQLMALALGLYLMDSVLLLRDGEGVLVARFNNTWKASLGTTDFLLAGKPLYLCHPLTPGLPVFRLGWNLGPSTIGKEQLDLVRISRCLRAIGCWASLAGVAILAALPVIAFAGVRHPLTAVFVTAVYSFLLVAVFKLVRHRRAIGLGKRRVAAFAFEAIACPPFGVNLARRVSLALPISEQLPDAAQRALMRDDWLLFSQVCLSHIEEALAVAEPESQRAAWLAAQRERLRASSGRED